MTPLRLRHSEETAATSRVKDKTMTKKKKQTNLRLSDKGNANLLTLRELLGGPIGPAKSRETIEWAIEQAIEIARKKVRTKGST